VREESRHRPATGPTRRLVASAIAAAGIGIVLFGSSSSFGASERARNGARTAGSGGTIQVAYVGDLTGVEGYLGTTIDDGFQVALKAVNGSKLLGGRSIALTPYDTTSTPATGTIEMAQAVESSAVAIFGPLLSSETASMSAQAEQAGVVFYVFGESPTALVAGKYIYRLQSNETHWVQLIYDKLAKIGVTTANILYSSDQPALLAVAGQAAGQLSQVGISVGTVTGIPTATNSYAATATSILASNPGAIGLFNTSGAVPAIITAIRTAGFRGPIFTDGGATDGDLTPDGSLAYGTLYGVGYNPGMTYPSSKEFTKLWEQAYPSIPPNAYAAYGYDTMMAFADAVAKSKQAPTRASVLKGMQALAAGARLGNKKAKPVEGAQGPIYFIGPTYRDVTAGGSLVQWEPTGETLLAVGKPGLLQQPLKK
jgi:branched-chain amino acid transport system substrate-binding protein